MQQVVRSRKCLHGDSYAQPKVIWMQQIILTSTTHKVSVSVLLILSDSKLYYLYNNVLEQGHNYGLSPI